MKRQFFLVFILMTTMASLLVTINAALGQTDNPPETLRSTGYNISWWTVDGGGTTNQEGGGYTLAGTIGQTDAAVWSNGGYTITGGYWEGTADVLYQFYLPLVMRGG